MTTEPTYEIVRFYRDDDDLNQTIVTRGMTLQQAEAHCQNPDTSSTTCKTLEGVLRTARHGPWCDGYRDERS